VQAEKNPAYPKNRIQMKKILLIIPLLIGCSSTKEKSEYESLFDYEGKYEYVDNTTLELKASAIMQNTL
jgi:hypothetical protein